MQTRTIDRVLWPIVRRRWTYIALLLSLPAVLVPVVMVVSDLPGAPIWALAVAGAQTIGAAVMVESRARFVARSRWRSNLLRRGP